MLYQHCMRKNQGHGRCWKDPAVRTSVEWAGDWCAPRLPGQVTVDDIQLGNLTVVVCTPFCKMARVRSCGICNLDGQSFKFPSKHLD